MQRGLAEVAMMSGGLPKPEIRNYFTCSNNLSPTFLMVIRDDTDFISMIITRKQVKLSQTHQKALKEELTQKISSHSAIVGVTVTRNRHLILTTKKIQTAP